MNILATRRILGFLCVLSAIFCLPAVAGEWVMADKVFDGDTIRLSDGRIVRYLGIDAPEIAHADHGAEPYGYDAKAANEDLVMHHRIRLETADYGRDRYGRFLGRIILANGESVGRILVVRGLATVLRTPSTIDVDKVLIAAQRSAMTRNIGLWTSLPAVSGPFLGNRHSWRFHLQNCPFAIRTSGRNRVVLQSLRQTFWLGYTPCSRCLAHFYQKATRRRSK